METSKRRITAIVATSLAGVLAVGYVAASAVTHSWNPVDWTKEETAITTETSGGLIVGKSVGKLTLTSISAASVDDDPVVNSYALVVSNDNDLTLTYAWSVAFENAQSTWASGKNADDYLTISLSDDTATATITAKQAFGEPIIVTVEAAGSSAQCTLDYVRPVEDVEIVLNDGSNIFYLNTANKFEFKPVFASDSVGTVEGTITCGSDTVYMEFGEGLKTYMTSVMGDQSYDNHDAWCKAMDDGGELYSVYNPIHFKMTDVITPKNILDVNVMVYDEINETTWEHQAHTWGDDGDKKGYNAIIDYFLKEAGESSSSDRIYFPSNTVWSYNYQGVKITTLTNKVYQIGGANAERRLTISAAYASYLLS